LGVDAQWVLHLIIDPDRIFENKLKSIMNNRKNKLYDIFNSNHEIYFDLNILFENSVYYPNADPEVNDIDGDPLRIFGNKFPSFVYSCEKLDLEKIKNECHGRGCGNSNILVHERVVEVGSMRAHWSLWKYRNEQEDSSGFSLLIIESPSIQAVLEIYRYYSCSPIMICFISKKYNGEEDIPAWVIEISPEYILIGGFSQDKSAYNSPPSIEYELIDKPQPQTVPGSGTTYAGIHIFLGVSWDNLPRYGSRGYGKKLRLYRRIDAKLEQFI
jgi:hypothetical protein